MCIGTSLSLAHCVTQDMVCGISVWLNENEVSVAPMYPSESMTKKNHRLDRIQCMS